MCEWTPGWAWLWSWWRRRDEWNSGLVAVSSSTRRWLCTAVQHHWRYPGVILTTRTLCATVVEVEIRCWNWNRKFITMRFLHEICNVFIFYLYSHHFQTKSTTVWQCTGSSSQVTLPTMSFWHCGFTACQYYSCSHLPGRLTDTPHISQSSKHCWY